MIYRLERPLESTITVFESSDKAHVVAWASSGVIGRKEEQERVVNRYPYRDSISQEEKGRPVAGHSEPEATVNL